MWSRADHFRLLSDWRNHFRHATPSPLAVVGTPNRRCGQAGKRAAKFNWSPRRYICVRVTSGSGNGLLLFSPHTHTHAHLIAAEVACSSDGRGNEWLGCWRLTVLEGTGRRCEAFYRVQKILSLSRGVCKNMWEKPTGGLFCSSNNQISSKRTNTRSHPVPQHHSSISQKRLRHDITQ